MNVLLGHNRYQSPGGEDVVYEMERRLLEEAGHRVRIFERHNREIEDFSRLQRLLLAKNAIWNTRAARDLTATIARERPDVAHFHNTLPLISPSAYYACRRAGVAVVQTIHNYRLVCPGGLLFRQGRVCEACVGATIAWRGVRHGCYRGSRLQTAVVAGMTAYHWMRGTWVDLVDVYIALSEFAKSRLVAGGIPEERIRVKPNCAGSDDQGEPPPGDYAVFI
ncbi:MAG: glycosyltransferase, partial [Tepidiformaceae bacterium]